MTATATLNRADAHRPRRWSSRSAGAENVARSAAPPLGPRAQLIRAVLVLFLALTGTLLLQLVLISSLQQSAAQGRAFDAFRSDLATGTYAQRQWAGSPGGPVEPRLLRSRAGRVCDVLSDDRGVWRGAHASLGY